jgi:hypothetical protein
MNQSIRVTKALSVRWGLCVDDGAQTSRRDPASEQHDLEAVAESLLRCSSLAVLTDTNNIKTMMSHDKSGFACDLCQCCIKLVFD